jgi:hypothetical protein
MGSSRVIFVKVGPELALVEIVRPSLPTDVGLRKLYVGTMISIHHSLVANCKNHWLIAKGPAIGPDIR